MFTYLVENHDVKLFGIEANFLPLVMISIIMLQLVKEMQKKHYKDMAIVFGKSGGSVLRRHICSDNCHLRQARNC